jgi:hypothetical protein
VTLLPRRNSLAVAVVMVLQMDHFLVMMKFGVFWIVFVGFGSI